MKQARILLMVFVIFGAARIFAQENSVLTDKWTRIETDNKEFSVALPPHYIVDAEKRKAGQKLRIIAFQNGVQMELQITKDSNLKNRLKYLSLAGASQPKIFTVGDFSVSTNETLSSAPKLSDSFWVTKKDSLYFLLITAKTGEEKEFFRFLNSINIQGKPLFVKKDKSDFPEDRVPVSSLKTSSEVIEAFSREPAKSKINVTYEIASNEMAEAEVEGLTRKAIILERSFPAFSQSLTNGSKGAVINSVKLRINLLANGQVGDITVLSTGDKDVIKSCIEAVRKTRFIPAQINSKDADSSQIVIYSTFRISS